MIRLVPLSPGLELEQAENLRRASVSTDFERALISESEIMGVKIPETRFLIKNLISEKSINLVNGFRGMGKSWFVEAIANEVTWGSRMGPWEIGESVNTLLVDGEMTMSVIQDRLKMMNIGRPHIRNKPSLLFIYPESYAYRIGLKRANLLDAKWREGIAEVCRQHNIGLLILDNLSSLAPGIDENDKMMFDPINRWMLELRFHGVTIILTHHVGKSGDQRGTTAHEDHIDTSLLLTRPSNYDEVDGCKFICRITKDRSHLTSGKQYTLQLYQTNCGNLEFKIVANLGLDFACQAIIDNPDLTQEEAIRIGVAQKTYQRAKDRLGIKKRRYEKKPEPKISVQNSVVNA